MTTASTAPGVPERSSSEPKRTATLLLPPRRAAASRRAASVTPVFSMTMARESLSSPALYAAKLAIPATAALSSNPASRTSLAIPLARSASLPGRYVSWPWAIFLIFTSATLARTSLASFLVAALMTRYS